MLLASMSFRAQPHKRAEVLSAVDETVRRMRMASGCARSRVMADAEDQNAFTLLSEWQSTETADALAEAMAMAARLAWSCSPLRRRSAIWRSSGPLSGAGGGATGTTLGCGTTA